MDRIYSAIDYYRMEINRLLERYRLGMDDEETFVAKKSTIYMKAKEREKNQIANAWEAGNTSHFRSRDAKHTNEFGIEYYDKLF